MNVILFGAMLGGWELLFLLLMLFMVLAVPAAVLLLVIWLVRRGQRHAAVPPPAQTPPPAPPQPGTCPRCGAPLPPGAPQDLCPRCVMGVGLDTHTETQDSRSPHGTKIVPPPEAEVAQRFPHLEILECLGHGGMGVVYKARQPKLNRLVALKILAPEKGADPKFAERFLREAQALARLNHPNIVTVHDYGEADGMFFLLMEYVDGMTLRQLLREERMKPEEALAIVPRICEALQFAHDEGIVHRDIKPENILLDKKGRVKIADFGIAKLMRAEARGRGVEAGGAAVAGSGAEKPPSAALTDAGKIIGTPQYMAPEQLERPQLVDHRADIYSLGVVFYEMLTGELPLGMFAPPSRKVGVDVRLDEVVLRALEKEPERRYQQASQVKTDVETIASTQTAPAGPGRSAPKNPGRRAPVAAGQKPDHFWRWFAVASVAIPIGLILLVLGGAVVLPVVLRVGSSGRYRAAMQPNLVVSGVVTDAATGKPIAGARVDDNRYGASPNRAPRQAWTAANGRYVLWTWNEEHTIAVSAKGYQTSLATLLPKPPGKTHRVQMDFQLQPANTAKSPGPRTSNVQRPTSKESRLRSMFDVEHWTLDVGSLGPGSSPATLWEEREQNGGGGNFEKIPAGRPGHPLA